MKIKCIKLWDESKAAIKENFIILNKYIVNEVLTIYLNTSSKKLGKEEQTNLKKIERRK